MSWRSSWVSATDGTPSPFRGYFVAKVGQRMQHGTPWLRLLWDPSQKPPRSVNVRGNITLAVAFGEVGLASDDFSKIASSSSRSSTTSWPTFPRPSLWTTSDARGNPWAS